MSGWKIFLPRKEQLEKNREFRQSNWEKNPSTWRETEKDNQKLGEGNRVKHILTLRKIRDKNRKLDRKTGQKTSQPKEE